MRHVYLGGSNISYNGLSADRHSGRVLADLCPTNLAVNLTHMVGTDSICIHLQTSPSVPRDLSGYRSAYFDMALQDGRVICQLPEAPNHND